MSAIVQNAAQNIQFYLRNGSGDPAVGLTLTNLTMQLRKEGETVFTAHPIVASGPTGAQRLGRELGLGFYQVVLSTADTNTLGPLDTILQDSTLVAKDDPAEYSIQTADESSLKTAINAVAADVWAYGTRTLTAFTGFSSDIASAVWGAVRATYATVGSFGETNQISPPSVSAIVNGILDEPLAGHTVLGTLGDNTQNPVPSSADIAGSVWDELTSAHTTAGTFGETNQATANPTAADIADAVWNETLVGHTTVGSFGATNQTNPPSVGAIADAVWDEPQAGHTGLGTFGENVQEPVPGPADIAASVWDELQSLHDTPGTFGGANQDTTNPTAAVIAAAVLDEPLAGHTTTGTLGGNTQEPVPGPSDIASAVFDEVATLHVTPGSFGYELAKEASLNSINSALTQLQLTVSRVKDFQEGRWVIENNQFKVYTPSGGALLATFNLFDKLGQPTDLDPFDRQPV